jgi:hypothetical protein
VIARAIVLSVGVVACAAGGARHDTGASAGAERLTLEVGPARVPCTGEARTQCLRVRVLPDTAWQLFYSRIDGFDFEDGFRWRLEVERRRVPNPPADASSLSYRLVRVISKERAP